MRKKSKYIVEELNERLKQLTGSSYEVDLRKMTLNEVQDLIWNCRFRIVENLKNTKAEGAVKGGMVVPHYL